MLPLFRPVFLLLILLLNTTTIAFALPGVRSVKITNTRSDWFYIEEIEIVNTGNSDVASSAFGTTATANTPAGFGSSVNGAIDDAIGSCCGTGYHSDNNSSTHEYTITFPSPQEISGTVTMWNRQDGCCAERMDGMHVEFFDGPNGTGTLLGEVQVDNLATDSNGAISTSTGAAFLIPEPPTPVINFFTTDHGNITATGDPNLPTSATLSWSVTNADTTSIDQGVGSVAATDQQSVSPSTETTYTLTATNADGPTTASVTIAVDQPVLPPTLTEFMADNASTISDQDGDSPDWIELHNPNAFSLGIAGFHLTDNALEPTQWTFPAGTSIPADGYLIVFASGKNLTDIAEPLHTNFSLRKSGEYLALIDTDGTTPLDDFTFPSQKEDVSYGLDTDGSTIGFFIPATPGSANGSTFAGFVEDTDFNISRGFYETAQSIEITTLTPAATIRFTTDGSRPSETSGTIYTAPISISSTTVLRAMAYKSGLASTNVDTNTYLFVDDVIASPDLGVPVTQQMRDSLKAVPSLSIVTPDTISGNTEVPTSFELINPDGTPGFQENCGIKQFGGAFTNFDKKSFRMYFRSQYGASKLKYPLFEGFDRDIAATDTFDQLNIRSGSHDMNQRGFYMSNRFTDDSMLDMGQINPHGRFMHLYINGRYWGVFHVRERWSASTLTEYLGGPKDAYEAINGNWNVGGWADSVAPPYDGDGSAWTRIKALALSSNPSNYDNLKPYLDTTHFIDYMIMWMYGNSEDEYRCTGPADVGSGFKWFLNDADGYLRNTGNRTGFASPSPGVFGRSAGDGPGSIFSLLFKAGNPEYRTLLADRIHKHYFNDGAMTPAKTDARLRERCDEMDSPFRAEAIRWNYRSHSNWTSQKNSALSSILPGRTASALSNFRSAGFYPSTDAPVYSQHGGNVPPGFNLTMSDGDGTMYYTTDGSDPRLEGGAVSPSSQSFQGGQTTTTSIAAGSDWKYLDDGSNQGTAWRTASFDDSSWAAGPAILGYNEPTVVTTISYGPTSSQKYTTTYFRKTVSVSATASILSGEVLVKRDDGAVVYLNGTEVGRSSMPAGAIGYQTFANSASDDGAGFHSLTVPANLFVEGDNVIAVELHQATLSSSDTQFDLELKITKPAGGASTLTMNENTLVRSRSLDGSDWSALNEAFFNVSDSAPVEPGEIVPSEIHYNPPGPDTSEFIELHNLAGHAINLRGCYFSAGIDFAFPANRDVPLAPGERVLLVDSQFGIDETYGIGLPIAGVYRDNLNNGGEPLTLLASDGTTELFSVTYDGADPWPEEADGDGHSLILTDPSDLNSPNSWRPSIALAGSPGTGEGTTFSGDPNADSDNDGISAFVEYATGTDDTLHGDSTGFPLISIDENGHWQVSFAQALGADDIRAVLEYSTDLSTWEEDPSAANLTSSQLIQGRLVRTHTSTSQIAASGPRQFVRIRYESNP